MNSPSPTPQRVLVTGSSRGIGAAIARAAAAAGYVPVLHCAHSRAAAAALAADLAAAHPGLLPAPPPVLQFDIADRDAARAALEADLAAHGPYYAIVLNAGVSDDFPFPGMEPAQWDRVLHTDLDSFYNVLSPCLQPMLEHRIHGRIVTIASVSGLVGNRGQVNYSAAKAGLIGATKALALELAKRQITVNCVAPGIIDTDMTAELPRADLERLIPLRRLGTPADVAALVLFLLSPAAAYITRQVISVNGGLV